MSFERLVGRGRTSDVYAYGADSVIKVPHADVPADWPGFEAELTAAVRSEGVPVPEVREVVEFQGRPAVVFEQISGPSMWECVLADPGQAEHWSGELAAIQRSLLTVGIPTGVPELVDRTVRKIALADALSEDDRAEAIDLARALPRGAALLHGDLHPGNVLMSDAGPIVIDWFDATIGHPVADLVRSSILMRPSESSPLHLPGASPGLLGRVQRAYAHEFSSELGAAADRLHEWRAVAAAGRLAEGADHDESGLISLWQERRAPSPDAGRH